MKIELGKEARSAHGRMPPREKCEILAAHEKAELLVRTQTTKIVFLVF